MGYWSNPQAVDDDLNNWTTTPGKDMSQATYFSNLLTSGPLGVLLGIVMPGLTSSIGIARKVDTDASNIIFYAGEREGWAIGADLPLPALQEL